MSCCGGCGGQNKEQDKKPESQEGAVQKQSAEKKTQSNTTATKISN